VGGEERYKESREGWGEGGVMDRDEGMEVEGGKRAAGGRGKMRRGGEGESRGEQEVGERGGGELATLFRPQLGREKGWEWISLEATSDLITA